jgi:hypothetical protein
VTYYNPATAEVGDTLYLASPFGWDSHEVTEWVVTRKTPKGQLVCTNGFRELRLSASGRIVGEQRWSRTSFVAPEAAVELRAERAKRDLWQAVASAAEALEKAARHRTVADAKAAFERVAQGMSAFGRDPQGHEAKPASPVGSEADDAPTPSSTPLQGTTP